VVEHAEQLSTNSLALFRKSGDLDQGSHGTCCLQAKVWNSELLFTHQGSAEAVKELQERVFMEKAVENMMLQMSVLPPRELPILAGALPLYKNLKVLRISNSQVDCQGAEALSTVLTMSELHFNKLRISGDAVCKLALGLKGNSAVLKVALTE